MNEDFETFLQLWQATDKFITNPTLDNENAAQDIIEKITGQPDDNRAKTIVEEHTSNDTLQPSWSGVSIEWYQDRRDVIRFIYKSPWTWEELAAAFEQGKMMMESVSPQIVHVFIDMSQHDDILPASPWENGKKLDQDAAKNEGLRITIGANSFVVGSYKAKPRSIELESRAATSGRLRNVKTLAQAEHEVLLAYPDTPKFRGRSER